MAQFAPIIYSVQVKNIIYSVQVTNNQCEPDTNVQDS